MRLALACLLARGHLLIEDLPGMGKTTLSHALARVLGLSFQRIQFTSDLLPGDILGTSVFDKDSGQFVFHPGRSSPSWCSPTRSTAPRRKPERLARGDGRRPGDHRGRHPAPAGTVLRHRHAEPGQPGRHLLPAGIAAGSLPDAPVAGYPDARRNARCCSAKPGAICCRAWSPCSTTRRWPLSRPKCRGPRQRCAGGLRAAPGRSDPHAAGLRPRPVAAR